MDEYAILQKYIKWLQDLSKGTISHELEVLTLKGLQILHAQNGFICCSFVVPCHASDPDGNWHVGAIATLIDDVAAAAIYSVADHVRVSLDLTISFYSTAKIQEEVEIEAKVIGEKGRLSLAVVEVRRKGNRELIALGKLWMATFNESSRKSSHERSLSRKLSIAGSKAIFCKHIWIHLMVFLKSEILRGNMKTIPHEEHDTECVRISPLSEGRSK